MLGYAAGIHAPGRTEPGAAVAAAHHLLLAHGLAVEVLRDRVTADETEIGITVNPYPVLPADPDPTPADLDAVRRIDGIANRLWYDAVLRGRYPDDVLADVSTVSDLAHVRDGDLAQIARPIDALGLNYYRCYHVRHEPGASAVAPWPGSPDVAFAEATATPTSNGWAVEPEGLYDSLVRLAADYDPPPLYVHESGGAFPDKLVADGQVHDHDRLAYLDAHLRASHDAIAARVDLRGYFVWSLLDNFEWAEGYRQRFGIVHVDFATQRRTPKASALWFRDVIRAHGLMAWA
jgi:beta-glucosidase